MENNEKIVEIVKNLSEEIKTIISENKEEFIGFLQNAAKSLDETIVEDLKADPAVDHGALFRIYNEDTFNTLCNDTPEGNLKYLNLAKVRMPIVRHLFLLDTLKKMSESEYEDFIYGVYKEVNNLTQSFDNSAPYGEVLSGGAKDVMDTVKDPDKYYDMKISMSISGGMMGFLLLGKSIPLHKDKATSSRYRIATIKNLEAVAKFFKIPRAEVSEKDVRDMVNVALNGYEQIQAA